MKRVVMAAAIAVAANFAGSGFQPARAVDAHDHSAHVAKGKKATTPVARAGSKTKRQKNSRIVHCPMMHGHMAHGQMMKGGMTHGHVKHGGTMKCPMMGSGAKGTRHRAGTAMGAM
jgi:hypothetical protein